jgi:Xaa-Pro dipeptidase
MAATEEQCAAELLEAQTKADALFREVESRGLIRPGITTGDSSADPSLHIVRAHG